MPVGVASELPPNPNLEADPRAIIGVTKALDVVLWAEGGGGVA